jgi:lipid-binding SYLF domain-containing protein
MSTKHLITGFLLALASVALSPVSFAADAQRKQVTAAELEKTKPSATVEFEVAQFRLIFGGQKGKGVLNYQGKKYPFAIKGASVGASIGYTETEAAGTVHFLNKLEDFAGKYSGVDAGGTFVKGGGASSFENSKGVIMSLKSKSKGAALVLGMDGLEIEFDK